MSVKLLNEHHLEFLSLKGGCTGSSESIHVKMPHCRKSHATAEMTHPTLAEMVMTQVLWHHQTIHTGDFHRQGYLMLHHLASATIQVANSVTAELQWLKHWWLIHLGCLELSSWSLQVILCLIHPRWLELPLARTIFHGPKPVRAIEVLL